MLQIITPLLLILFLSTKSWSQQKATKVKIAKSSISASSPAVASASSATEKIPSDKKSFFLSPSEESITNALELLGINLFTIQLPTNEKKKYFLTVHRDEYTKGSAPKNTVSSFWEIKRLSTSKGSSATLSILAKGDSGIVFDWKKPSGSHSQFFNPKGRKTGLEYIVRPFKYQEVVLGRKIPVVLYGSSWYDAKNDIVRFCDENELNADFSSDAFKEMPHHYVFSIELSEATK